MQPGETNADKKTVSFAIFDSSGLPASGNVGEGAVATFATTELQISSDYGSNWTNATVANFAHGGDGVYKYTFADLEVAVGVGEKNLWLRYKNTGFKTRITEVPLRYDTDRVYAELTSTHTDVGTVNTKLGTPVGASISDDIAAVGTNANTAAVQASSTNTKLGTPVTSVSDDIADVKSDTSLLPAATPKIDVLHQIGVGRWKIQGTQLLIYASDGTTVLMTFNLKDDTGAASSTRIFERAPVP